MYVNINFWGEFSARFILDCRRQLTVLFEAGKSVSQMLLTGGNPLNLYPKLNWLENFCFSPYFRMMIFNNMSMSGEELLVFSHKYFT